MVVDRMGEKPREESPSEVKQQILDELAECPDAVLSLAYVYAKNYNLCGEDVTKTWTNVIQNSQFVEEIYRRGYEEAFKDFQEQKRKDFYHKVLRDLK